MQTKIELTEKEVKAIQKRIVGVIQQEKRSIYSSRLIEQDTGKMLNRLVIQANIIFLIEEIVGFLEEHFTMREKESHMVNNFIYWKFGREVYKPTNNTMETIEVSKSDRKLIQKRYPDIQKMVVGAKKIIDYYFPNELDPQLINSFFEKFIIDYLKRRRIDYLKRRRVD
jgi:hypothetical protein